MAKSELGAESLSALQTLVTNVVNEYEGEVLVSDDWGTRKFAQATSKGVKHGHFLYFIYKANNEVNVELARRFKINEDVLKSLVVKLDDVDLNAAKVIKAYKTPFSKNHPGSISDADENGNTIEKRHFASRKSCWFISNKIVADWKDPATYNWLVNEFGKISPARVSGVSRKHQRYSVLAIKRARQIGIISHMSNRFAE